LVVANPAAFHDDFRSLNTSRWIASNGRGYSPPTRVDFRPDHLRFGTDGMTILMNDRGEGNEKCPNACNGEPYSSGEIESRELFHYGILEAHMSGASHDGKCQTGTDTCLMFDTGPGDGFHGKRMGMNIILVGEPKYQDYVLFDYWISANRTLVDKKVGSLRNLENFLACKPHKYVLKWYPDFAQLTVYQGAKEWSSPKLHFKEPNSCPPAPLWFHTWPCSASLKWAACGVYPSDDTATVTSGLSYIKWTPHREGMN